MRVCLCVHVLVCMCWWQLDACMHGCGACGVKDLVIQALSSWVCTEEHRQLCHMMSNEFSLQFKLF